MNFLSILKMTWLLSYILLASVSAAMITPALPNIEFTFALGSGTVEWVVSTFLFGYVIGQLVYGPLANVYGRIRAMKWGLNINLYGLLLCIIASYYPNFFLLLVGRFITGLGSAAGLTCTFMLINEWLPENQRKTAMAYSILSFALGIGLAVLIGGIITEYLVWQGCFVFLLLQSIMMQAGLKVFHETLIKPKKFHVISLLRDYGTALCSFKLITFATIWGVCSAASYCYSAAAPQIAHIYLKLQASTYGYWNILNIIGMLIGGVSARYLMQQFTILQVISVGFIGCTIAFLSLLSMYLMENFQVLWFFLSTSTLYCCSSYLFAGGSFVASNAIEDKASASSMMSFINMGIATLSVILMSSISENPFIGFLGSLAGMMILALTLLIIFIMKNTRYKLN